MPIEESICGCHLLFGEKGACLRSLGWGSRRRTRRGSLGRTPRRGRRGRRIRGCRAGGRDGGSNGSWKAGSCRQAEAHAETKTGGRRVRREDAERRPEGVVHRLHGQLERQRRRHLWQWWRNLWLMLWLHLRLWRWLDLWLLWLLWLGLWLRADRHHAHIRNPNQVFWRHV